MLFRIAYLVYVLKMVVNEWVIRNFNKNVFFKRKILNVFFLNYLNKSSLFDLR